MLSLSLSLSPLPSPLSSLPSPLFFRYSSNLRWRSRYHRRRGTRPFVYRGHGKESTRGSVLHFRRELLRIHKTTEYHWQCRFLHAGSWTFGGSKRGAILTSVHVPLHFPLCPQRASVLLERSQRVPSNSRSDSNLGILLLRRVLFEWKGHWPKKCHWV